MSNWPETKDAYPLYLKIPDEVSLGMALNALYESGYWKFHLARLHPTGITLDNHVAHIVMQGAIAVDPHVVRSVTMPPDVFFRQEAEGTLIAMLIAERNSK